MLTVVHVPMQRWEMGALIENKKNYMGQSFFGKVQADIWPSGKFGLPVNCTSSSQFYTHRWAPIKYDHALLSGATGGLYNLASHFLNG